MGLATWNAVVAGACVQEAYKVILDVRPKKSFAWWGGESGAYVHGYGVGGYPGCKVCGGV